MIIIRNEETGYNAVVELDEDSGMQDPIREACTKNEMMLVSYHRSQGSNQGFAEAEEAIAYARQNGMHIFPIRAYVHSGTAYLLVADRVSEKAIFPASKPGGQFGCQFDSGWYGYLLIADNFVCNKERKPETVKGRLYRDKPRAEAFKLAEGYLKAYAAWAEGEIYRYNIYDKDGDFVEGCGGYLCDTDIAVADARVVLGLGPEE